MADFVETGQSKTAVREIAAPLSLAGINTLVTEVTGAGNPFATTGYTQGGVAHAGGTVLNKL